MSIWVLINPFQPIYVTQDGQTTRVGDEAAKFASKEEAEAHRANYSGTRYLVAREYEERQPETK